MSILILPIILILLYLLECVLYTRFWNKGLSSTLTFQSVPATEGDTAVLTEVIANRGWLPLPVLQVNFRLEKGLRVLGAASASVSDLTNMTELFSLMPWQQVTRELTLDCRQRGYYRIVGNTLVAGDLFASRTYHAETSQDTELYVYPRFIESPLMEVPFSYLMGEVRSRQMLYEDAFAFRGIRDYAPTDPMGRINWKASARTGELKVNLREYTAGQQVMILLNVEEPLLQFLDVILEDSIRYALTLSAMLLEEQIPVGILSNGQDVVSGGDLKIEPGSSPGHLKVICEGLSRIDLGRKEEDFAPYLRREVLEQEENRTGGGITYVLISSSRRTPTVEAAQELALRQGRLLWLCPITASMDKAPVEGEGMEMMTLVHTGK